MTTSSFLITVLRLNHRSYRDKRVTTHIALTTRAFGGAKMYYSGQHDLTIEESVNRVTKTWGGQFKIEHISTPLNFIRGWEGISIHLTMYGRKLGQGLQLIREKLDSDPKIPVLIIVGGAKVPPAIYQDVTYNLSVGNQPHSEIAALAIVMDRLLSSQNLEYDFANSRLTIVPASRGKNVRDHSITNETENETKTKTEDEND